jgi:hypothetical protein
LGAQSVHSGFSRRSVKHGRAEPRVQPCIGGNDPLEIHEADWLDWFLSRKRKPKIGDRLQIARQNTNLLAALNRANLVPVTDFLLDGENKQWPRPTRF